MCGIVAYLGKREAYPILINGLRRLEYRGYDSAGVALMDQGKLTVYKCKGKVSDLEAFVGTRSTQATVAIGHTRWATHGPPNDVNAHPHQSTSGDLVLIHNGIIENYASLKVELVNRGHSFLSDTDTEVLVHLIDDIQRTEKVDLAEAVRLALQSVVGAYAIVVLDKKAPDMMVAARKSSPLVIGIGDGEYFAASDATPIVEHTKNVVYLEDGEIAVIDREHGLKIRNVKNQEKTPFIQELELHLEALEKGGYDHFMLKEIHEQPRSIRDSMRGRLNLAKGEVVLGGITDHEQKFVNAKRILIVACGTSWHAGMVGEYLFEEFARIPGLATPRDEHGIEIGVASTKAFTAQVTVLTLMALMVGQKKGVLSGGHFHRLLNELDAIPEKVQKVLGTEAQIKYIADIYKNATNALYLGRGYTFPVALEGALKLKEISYIHAEGYPAAEMKHGPIALIDEAMPVIVIATKGASYEKVVSNIQEVKARKGKVIAIVTEGDTVVKDLADHVIEIPETSDALVPLLSVVPLQLLSYHIAVMRGCNVDQPRNLAKSVTVE